MEVAELKYKDLMMKRDNICKELKSIDQEIEANEYKKWLANEEKRNKYCDLYNRLLTLKYPKISLSGSLTREQLYHLADNIHDINLDDKTKRIKYRYKLDGKDYCVLAYKDNSKPTFNMTLIVNDVGENWDVYQPFAIVLPALLYLLFNYC